VVTDCDLTATCPAGRLWKALALQPVDREGLLDFYQRFGFKTWRKELEPSLGLPSLAAVAWAVRRRRRPAPAASARWHAATKRC
jgi:DNA polymerase-1